MNINNNIYKIYVYKYINKNFLYNFNNWYLVIQHSYIILTIANVLYIYFTYLSYSLYII